MSPVIPKYTRQQSIPGKSGNVLQNPANAGLESQAIAGAFKTFGDEASKFGDVIVKRREELKKQKLISDGLQIKSLYDEDRRAFMATEAQVNDADIYTNLDRGKKFKEDSEKKHTDNIQDPGLKLAVKSYIHSDMDGNLDQLSSFQAKRHGELISQRLDNEEAGAVKDAALGLKTVDELVSNYTDIIKMQLDAGGIKGKEAEDRIVKATQKIAEAQLDGLVVNDPTGAEVLIKAGVYNKYLPGEKINIYAAKAKAIKEAREKDAKDVAKEAKRLKEEELKEAREQRGIEFAKALSQGKLTEQMIVASNLEGTGENSINSWLEKLRSKTVIKTDTVFEAQWYEKIDGAEDPATITNSEIRAGIFTGKVSVDDANKIIAYKDKLIKGDDPLKSEAVKIARIRLTDAKNKKMFNSEDMAKNSAQWGKYNSLLTRYVENNPKAIPEEIYSFVDTIMEPVKQGWIGGMIDALRFGTPGEDKLQKEKETQLESLAGTEKEKKKFDPEGADYDYESAKSDGLSPDETGHWPSRNPKTGQILKGKKHPTFHKTIIEEEKVGYEIYKDKTGKYYSRPTLQKFLKEARKVNKGMSDADLTQYYNKKYGGE